MLDELETVFEEPIHLCDVKPDHFGISDSGRVKFLDLDSVFLKPYLGKILRLFFFEKSEEKSNVLVYF